MSYRLTRVWIFGIAIGVMLMIVVGGYTRLTHAGLALVDWKPIVGIVPPLSSEAWQAEWLKYQQFPEFQKGIVTDFALFQKLFWIEYAHRLLGRLVGLWLIFGTLIGLITKAWPAWLSKRVVFWCLGIAFQGWMGWYMVQSGLVNDPQVSPYRLTAHLWVAFALLTSVVGAYIRLLRGRGAHSNSCVNVALIFLGFTLTWGGFVAGHKAGLIYNTFPLMEGCFFPSDAWFYQPIWVNVYSNPVCVQALHRYLAFATLALITLSLYRVRTRHAAIWCVLAYIQASLGVVTLLTQVHLHPALTHQACGAVLWVWGWVMVRRSCVDRSII